MLLPEQIKELAFAATVKAVKEVVITSTARHIEENVRRRYQSRCDKKGIRKPASEDSLTKRRRLNEESLEMTYCI